MSLVDPIFGVAQIAVSVVLVMFSAMVHEVAHGWVALKCGDATAKEAGRLTLDPRAHMDGLGSFVLPLMMALMGWPMLAFAKPVPYNPRRLRHPRRDELLVALAGPASNLLQAALGTLLVAGWYALVYKVLPVSTVTALLTPITLLGQVLRSYVYVNLVLAFFNLIPIPPLDGSKVLLFFLKGRAREKFYELQQYSVLILFGVLYVIPRLFYVDPLGSYISLTAGSMCGWLMALARGMVG